MISIYYTKFDLFTACYYDTLMVIRLRKKNSKSQSPSQIGKPDLNAGFFFNVFLLFLFWFVLFCFVFSSSRFFKLELVTTLFSLKYGTRFLDEQDTRQNTELKKSVVQSILLCLSCLFIYIDKQVHKTLKKRKRKKKKKINQAKKLKS